MRDFKVLSVNVRIVANPEAHSIMIDIYENKEALKSELHYRF